VTDRHSRRPRPAGDVHHELHRTGREPPGPDGRGRHGVRGLRRQWPWLTYAHRRAAPGQRRPDPCRIWIASCVG